MARLTRVGVALEGCACGVGEGFGVRFVGPWEGARRFVVIVFDLPEPFCVRVPPLARDGAG